MSLQQDVIDSIPPDGIEKDRLRERVGNIGQAELDRIVTELMKGGRIALNFGRYEVIPSTRPPGGMATTAPDTAPAANPKLTQREERIDETGPDDGTPPSAEEEAAASLRPATRICQDCGDEKDIEKEFSKSNLGTGYLKTCKKCMGKRAHGAKAKKEGIRQRALEVTGKAGAPIEAGATDSSKPAPTTPTVADSVFDRVKADRERLLQKRAELVERRRQLTEQINAEILANDQEIGKRDEFLEMYERFAQTAPGDAHE